MFTSHQIGYDVENAFVTINVEIWWLQSAESGFLMYVNRQHGNVLKHFKYV
jgi:hypothetical protein